MTRLPHLPAHSDMDTEPEGFNYWWCILGVWGLSFVVAGFALAKGVL